MGPQLFPLLLPFFVNLSQTPLPPPPMPEHFYPSHLRSPSFVFPPAEGPWNSNRILKRKCLDLRSVYSSTIWLPVELIETNLKPSLSHNEGDLLFARPESMQFIKLHWSAQCGAAQDLLQDWQPFSWRWCDR